MLSSMLDHPHHSASKPVKVKYSK